MEETPGWVRKLEVAVLAAVVVTSLISGGVARADTGVREYFRAGNRAIDNGSYDKAVDYYEEGLNIEPEHAGLLNNYGNVLLLKEDYEQSEKVFREVLKLEPGKVTSRAEVLSRLASSLLGQGRVEQARKRYLNALKSDSGLVSANFNLGNIYKSEGNLESARRLYSRVLRENSRHRKALLSLGNVLHAQGSYEKADVVYSRATEYFPQAADILNEHGILKLRQGNLNEAEDLFKKAVRNDGSLARAYSNLGQVYYLKNQLENAISNFEKAVELDTTLADAYTDLGLSYLNTGDYKKSFSALQKAIQASPNNLEAFYNLALLYEEKKQYSEAMDVYEKVLQLEPQHYKTLNNLGLLVLERKNDPEGALEYFKRAVDSKPDLGEARYNLAYANYILENKEKAAQILNSIVENADSYGESLVKRSRETLEKMNF